MVCYAGNLRFCLTALEDELRKIQVFRRELPLCYEVVTQTIEVWKQKLVEKDEVVDCDLALSEDQTSPEPPVLAEFMPLRHDVGGDDLRWQRKSNSDRKEKKKSEWLRSAQLWNPIPDLNAQEDDDGDKDDSLSGAKAIDANASSLLNPAPERQQGRGDDSEGGDGKVKDKQRAGNAQRKQRRCWSTELHRRFLNALQDLGGPQVATPKQIKERMKVDGLTNDEIKSHLQKFRLHTRQSQPAQNDDNPIQAPQLVVVGGIWMPPADFTAMADSVPLPPTNKIYAPVATIPTPQSSNFDPKTSPTASSSAHTITDPVII